MPTVEYICQACKHTFSRLIFLDDPVKKQRCPACGAENARLQPGQKNLFRGIANFSELAANRD